MDDILFFLEVTQFVLVQGCCVPVGIRQSLVEEIRLYSPVQWNWFSGITACSSSKGPTQRPMRLNRHRNTAAEQHDRTRGIFFRDSAATVTRGLHRVFLRSSSFKLASSNVRTNFTAPGCTFAAQRVLSCFFSFFFYFYVSFFLFFFFEKVTEKYTRKKGAYSREGERKGVQKKEK